MDQKKSFLLVCFFGALIVLCALGKLSHQPATAQMATAKAPSIGVMTSPKENPSPAELAWEKNVFKQSRKHPSSGNPGD